MSRTVRPEQRQLPFAIGRRARALWGIFLSSRHSRRWRLRAGDRHVDDARDVQRGRRFGAENAVYYRRAVPAGPRLSLPGLGLPLLLFGALLPALRAALLPA